MLALLERARRAALDSARRARDRVLATGPARVALWRRAYDPWDRVEILKPIPVEVFSDERIAAASLLPEIRFSVVATVRDEASSAEPWLESLAAQVVRPLEVVIQDGGSRDGTPERIERAAARLGLPARVLRADRPLNIAEGRNRAVAAAVGEVLLCTDAGCTLPPGWCRDLVAPFREAGPVDLAAGTYLAEGPADIASALAAGAVDPSRFLPSSRSIAFRRSLWARCGGYPEWLTLTGEDTLFDVHARRWSRAWAYVPSACVRWRAPHTLRELVRVSYRYGYGDGEAGLAALGNGYRRGEALARALRPHLLPVAAPLALARAAGPRRARALAMGAMTKGFLDGARARPRRLAAAGRTVGSALVLSGVPFSDSGGGQRGAQLALALVGRGYEVTFANVYPSFERPSRVVLDAPVEQLELRAIDDLDAAAWAASRSPGAPALVLMEFPHPRFLPIARRLRAWGARVVYDCIDAWDSSLGWIWYRERTEREILEASHVAVASARALQRRLEDMTGGRVHYLPQGVSGSFSPLLRPPLPPDLPAGAGPVLLYMGALWGPWLDWEALRAVAARFPAARVVVLGEYRGECPAPPPNLHFLGLKPHTALPAYVAAADVCLIPFKVDHITRSVNPVKVWEYLAMGKPVVASRLPEIEGMPWVTFAETTGDFPAAVERALAHAPAAEEAAAFAEANRWARRVDALLTWTGVDPAFP